MGGEGTGGGMDGIALPSEILYTPLQSSFVTVVNGLKSRVAVFSENDIMTGRRSMRAKVDLNCT